MRAARLLITKLCSFYLRQLQSGVITTAGRGAASPGWFYDVNRVYTLAVRHELLGDDNTLLQSELPIIQFSSAMYFCIENEGSLTLEIMRIGNVSHRSEVQYSTYDSSAKAGVKFKWLSPIRSPSPGPPGPRLVEFGPCPIYAH